MHVLTAAQLFRVTWPRHTAKNASAAADSPISTAKQWVQSRFTPSADTLLRMVAENEQLRTELLRQLGVEVNAAVAFRDGASAVPAGGAVVDEAGRASADPAEVERRRGERRTRP